MSTKDAKDKRRTQLAEATRQMNAGKHAQAESVLSNLLTSYPGDPEVCRLLATLHLKRGQLQVALSEFKFLATAAMRAQDYALAESMIKEYLEADPQCVALLELLGQVYEEKGDRASASAQYGHVIERLKNNSDPEWADLPRELYAKIKALTPNSPLVQGLAPMFEGPTVTAAAESPGEPPPPPTATAKSAQPPATDVRRADEVPAPVNSMETEADFRKLVGAEPPSPAVSAPLQEEVEETTQSTWSETKTEVPPAPTPRFRLSDRTPPVEPPAVHFEEPIPEPTPPIETRMEADVEPEVPVASEPDAVASSDTSTVEESIEQPSPLEAEKEAVRPRERPVVSRARKRPAVDYRTRYLRSRLSGWVTRTVRAAGVISRLIVLLLLLGIALPILGAGLMAITWLVLEQRPTQTFQTLSTVPPQPMPDPKRNGYFLLLGLASEPSVDPMKAGYEQWQRVELQRPPCLELSQNPEHPALVSVDSRELNGWFRDLIPTYHFRQQRELLGTWLNANRLLVSRYEQWLRMPFEDSGFGTFTRPDCAQVLAVHRLYLAKGFSEDTDEGILRLELDLAAWRNALAKSRSLSTKTLALIAMKDDVGILSDLLARPDLDNRKLPRLMRMTEPLDAAERSLRWPMLDEFLAEVKLKERRLEPETDVDRPILIQAVSWFPLPKQKALNARAAYYDALIKAAETSSKALPDAYEFSKTPPKGVLDYVTNPVDNLVGMDSIPNWDEQAGIVLEMDARLRLAGLQARLRTPSKDQRTNLLARIAEAGPTFYDPFTGLPMLTNGPKTMLYSIGRDLADNNGDPRYDITVPVFSATAGS